MFFERRKQLHENLYYRRNGTPYTGPDALTDFSEDFNNPFFQVVKQTQLPNGYRVSTVWLGLAHGYENERPLIFESIVFKGSDYHDLDMERYATEEEARAGHSRLVERWMKKPRPGC